MSAVHRRTKWGEWLRILAVAGLVGAALLWLVELVAYSPTPADILSPTSTYTPDLLATVASYDHSLTLVIAALGFGMLVQVRRLVVLHRRGVCHEPCAWVARRWDLALATLAALLLIPTLFGGDSRWADSTFYCYAVFGLVLLASSLACVAVAERRLDDMEVPA